MSAVGNSERPQRVESDGSEKLEADIPASCTDSLFSKPPQSGMADERSLAAILVNVSNVSILLKNSLFRVLKII
jgi:hypothetical protein